MWTHREQCGGRGCLWWFAGGRGPLSPWRSAGWGSAANPCQPPPLKHKTSKRERERSELDDNRHKLAKDIFLLIQVRLFQKPPKGFPLQWKNKHQLLNKQKKPHNFKPVTENWKFKMTQSINAWISATSEALRLQVWVIFFNIFQQKAEAHQYRMHRLSKLLAKRNTEEYFNSIKLPWGAIKGKMAC